VALVGHAYRARPGEPRVVAADDGVDEVGDEALLAARALAPAGAVVVVAPRRADAMQLATRLADVLVVDGVLQTAPARASLALLAVDAAEPWGRAPFVPPAGHLRAPREALLAACDMVVAVGDEPAADVRIVSQGVLLGGVARTWADLATGDLRSARFGLIAALARPERVVRFLARRGIALRAIVRAPDHGPFPASAYALAERAPVDMWLATPKCALHLRQRLAAPVAMVDCGFRLSLRLCSALAPLVRAGASPMP
jgi:tetraacyldisaccharide-1-P 4'-kinase